ncbi:epoxide hydrolase family protein [Sinobaca sp. H24]|uniref:epoxide hydrolase family protein n=1 Tax=Sinobaca sp. H24 TaxID=2923376 RepID=UPI0020794495|nr:epoxide hydrolase family protein [Sinobaca sp. H24]
MNIRPFSVAISDDQLLDLNRRLALTRWPDEIPDSHWSYGIPLDIMRKLASYWQNHFDWRVVEEYINMYPNYKVEIDGIDLHFLHIRGSGPKPMPLLLPHGWPGSVYEMLDIIPYLTTPEKFGGDPQDSFDIVIPSIPGHGFSSAPLKPGFEDRQAADIFVKLMDVLGYEKFGAHGYDLGASIIGLMCLDYPEKLIGYHTTSPVIPVLTYQRRLYYQKQKKNTLLIANNGIKKKLDMLTFLGRKPQTIAYSLNDSPIGLAAFILEKWYLWTDPPSGDLLKHFDKETLLANVSIYWFTQTINASNRYYYEGQYTKWPGRNDVSKVPIGVSLNATQFHERPPKEYVERLFPNVICWEDLKTGGHFVATEQPELIAKKIRSFFNNVNQYHG